MIFSLAYPKLCRLFEVRDLKLRQASTTFLWNTLGKLTYQYGKLRCLTLVSKQHHALCTQSKDLLWCQFSLSGVRSGRFASRMTQRVVYAMWLDLSLIRTMYATTPRPDKTWHETSVLSMCNVQWPLLKTNRILNKIIFPIHSRTAVILLRNTGSRFFVH